MTKRTLMLVFALGIAMGLALSVSTAEARDGSALVLQTKLYGERTRTLQADGGGLALWTIDGGLATATVPAGATILIECPAQGAFICSPEDFGAGWDGGCSSIISDPNYGSPIAVGGQRWVSLRDTTTTLKAIPLTGGMAQCPIWIAR